MSVQEFRLPALAESVVEGEVLGWRVAEGDTVQEGQGLLEVMTDKVTVELPSPYTGRVQRLLAGVGEIVAVGGTLALIETAVEAPVPQPMPEPAPAPSPETHAEATAGLREERSIIEATSARREDLSLLDAVFAGFGRPAPAPAVALRVLASPSARQLARQQNSGGGAVRQADVAAHLNRPASPPAPSGQPASDWPPPPPPGYRTPAGAEHLETPHAVPRHPPGHLAGAALQHAAHRPDAHHRRVGLLRPDGAQERAAPRRRGGRREAVVPPVLPEGGGGSAASLSGAEQQPGRCWRARWCRSGSCIWAWR